MIIVEVYKRLYSCFGKQYWWPGETKFEIVIGAILTQQTSWKQVEKSIDNLKKENLLSASSLSNSNVRKTRLLIKPSGFYKQKSRRIVLFSKYLMKKYSGDLKIFLAQPIEILRKELLSLEGIGKETADSILLYAGNKLIFPIDAYTFRIFERLGIVAEKTNYDQLQSLFHKELPHDLEVYNEFHALIVKHGKTLCKSKPLCSDCPLNVDCSFYKDLNKRHIVVN